jgi:hypothetical protein
VVIPKAEYGLILIVEGECGGRCDLEKHVTQAPFKLAGYQYALLDHGTCWETAKCLNKRFVYEGALPVWIGSSMRFGYDA